MKIVRCKTLQELKKEFSAINAGTGYATYLKFMAKSNMFIAERLEEIAQSISRKSRRGRRKASPYHQRLSKYLKEGKSLQEAHRLAKEQ